MDQSQVHVIRAQLFQALVQAGDQLGGAVVVGPDFGGDKQLIACHTAVGDGLADFGFVAINLCSVDGAVAHVLRIAYGVDSGLALQAEGASTKGRDGHGSAPHFWSDKGAEFAIQSAVELLSASIDKVLVALESKDYSKANKNIAKSYVKRWNRKCFEGLCSIELDDLKNKIKEIEEKEPDVAK